MSPLLDLLRTVVAARGEVTFRVLPSDDPQAATGCVDAEHGIINLPAPDRDTAHAGRMLVSALYQLSLADSYGDAPESAGWFVRDATRGTLAAMGNW